VGREDVAIGIPVHCSVRKVGHSGIKKPVLCAVMSVVFNVEMTFKLK